MFLVNSCGATILIVYLMITMSQIALRRRLQNAASGSLELRMWLFPYLSIAAACGIVAILGSMLFAASSRSQIILSVGAFAITLVAYQSSPEQTPDKERLMSPTLPDKAAAVIIGGGVIGTSIAFHLAAAGIDDVLLLERDELAAGSTCKAAGGVRASCSTVPNIEMGLRGLEAYSTFTRDHGQPIDFSMDGYLYLLSDQRTVDVFAESTRLQNSCGVSSKMISPEQARSLSPLVNTDGMLAACWSPDDARATPESVVMGYAASSRKLGARIVQHCEVTGIDVRGERIHAVHTDRGTVSTDTVICAAGAWSRAIGDMVGLDIPVTPVRRQIAFTGPLPSTQNRAPLTIDFPSNFYFHPEGSGLLLGWSDPDQPAGFNMKFELDDWLMGLGKIASVRAPAILDYGIASGWAGLYEVTPDNNQIIDRPSHLDGLIVATGYSGHGFLMGPATGEIVRDLCLGKTPRYDISTFRLARFADVTVGAGEVNIM